MTQKAVCLAVSLLEMSEHSSQLVSWLVTDEAARGSGLWLEMLFRISDGLRSIESPTIVPGALFSLSEANTSIKVSSSEQDMFIVWRCSRKLQV